MASNDKLVEIAKLLLEKTKSRDVTWEKTSTRGRFQTSFARYTIAIDGSSDAPRLYLFDEDGDVIEDLSASAAFQAHIYDEFKDLYERARRRALGADEALDEVAKALRSPSSVEKK